MRYILIFLLTFVFAFAEDLQKIKQTRNKLNEGINLSKKDYELMVRYGLCKPLSKNFYEDHDRGWFYGEECDYEKIEEFIRKREASTQPQENKEEKKLDITKADDKKYLSTLTAEEVRQLFNKVLDEASVNPTYDNVKRVVTMIDFMRRRAVKFARVWQHVIAGEEELDIRAKVPVTPRYRRTQKVLKEKRRLYLFTQEMKKNTAFFVFVSGSCPYCHKQMEDVHRIIATSGITVKVISKDFCPGEFPNCQVAPKMFERFGVHVTPTIVMVVRNKQGKAEFYPISRGLATYAEIVKLSTYFYEYSQNKQIKDY
ncbi:conjugal transfer protein TraF [Persephonella sp. KM09-Lau-8]|uniref:conjugal transfer protein TraF n=1 Tax=Persephonella sp. KM09-Lau-8 TaxID=1158345 RepID=UPI000497DFD2|nr:conjugal transfer protein TraF [Persephonella sp. KM09-Lau-8]